MAAIAATEVRRSRVDLRSMYFVILYMPTHSRNELFAEI